MKAGSVLVIDMSERAVKSGQTKPSEVLTLLRNGVKVHSVENLHAKVFVVGNQVLVGSTNASFTSANGLVEALLETNAQRTVRLCKDFVKSLPGEEINIAHAQRMQRLYRPPRFGTGNHQRLVKRNVHPAHSRLWVLPLERNQWDEEEEAHADAGRPKARKRMRTPRGAKVDEFICSGSDLIDRLAAGHLVVQIINEGSKQMLSPQARVLHIEKFKKGRFQMRSRVLGDFQTTQA
jgi:hypothetical protein